MSTLCWNIEKKKNMTSCSLEIESCLFGHASCVDEHVFEDYGNILINFS